MSIKYKVPCNAENDFLCNECGNFGYCKFTEPKKTGMSLTEMQAHLDQSAKLGVFGLSWDQLEQKLGGKITRPKP